MSLKILLLMVLLLLALGWGAFWILSQVREHLAAYDINERLWWAASQGDHQTVKALLRRGGNPNYSADGTFTVLMNAWSSEDPKTLQAVLEAKPALDPLLILACGGDMADFARFLVEHGADVNTRDATGKTALRIARERGCQEIVRLLQEAGAEE